MSHIFNLERAGGHWIKTENPSSCDNKGKRYVFEFLICRQKYSTLDLSFSAAIVTLMTTRTIAPTYFCTENPFPIDLRAFGHSIHRIPMLL